MHPLNFVRNDFITIKTATGTKKVSKRRYKVSNSYSGILTGYAGRIVRLISLGPDLEVGEHIDDILAVTLDDEDDEIDFLFGTSYVCAVGIAMRYLEPVAR